MIRGLQAANPEHAAGAAVVEPRVVMMRVGVLLSILAAAFREELRAIAWEASCFSEWSHAFALPIVAACFVVCRRDDLRIALRRGSAWGLGLIFIGLAAWFASTVTMQFGYARLLALCACAAGVVLAGAGWRVFWLCVPLFFMLWLCLPLTERTLASKTLGVQRLSIQTSAAILNAGPGLDAQPDGMTIAYRCGEKAGTIGVAEQRFGASLLPAGLQVGLLAIFARRRHAAVVFFLLLALVPVVLLSNVARIVTWGAAAAYGDFPLTSTIPRNLSMAAGLVCAVACLVITRFLVDGLRTLLSQIFHAEGDDPHGRDSRDSISSPPGGAERCA